MNEYKIDLKKKFKHLNHAPIVEAVIEISVTPTAEWDPDRLRDILKKRLPTYPKIQDMRQMMLQMSFGQGTPEGKHKTEDRGRVGYRLESEDKLHIAQFNMDVFRFSRVAPYSNWQSFAGEALKLWELYFEAMRPPQVLRLGVRYVNQMPFHPRVETLADFYKEVPKEMALGWPINNFFHHDKLDVPGLPYKVNLIRTRRPFQDSEALILDVDVFYDEKPFQCKTEIIRYHLDHMHILKNEVFHGSITPLAIKKYQ